MARVLERKKDELTNGLGIITGSSVFLYARVSSAAQADRENSIPTQFSEMREFAARHGLVVEEEFSEAASAFKNMGSNRKAFQRMLDSVETSGGRIRYVITHRLDRFARNSLSLMQASERLKSSNCRFIHSQDYVDERTPTGHLVTSLQASISQNYCEALSINVCRAHEERVTQGWFAAGRVPFGYRLEKPPGYHGRGKLVIDQAVVAIVVSIFEWIAQGYGLRLIAKNLNTGGYGELAGPTGFNRDRIASIVKNPLYIGRYELGRTRRDPRLIVTDDEWRIVPQDLWDAAQVSLSERRRELGMPKRGATPTRLLSGLLTCAKCGGGTVATNKGKGHWYYVCTMAHRGMCEAKATRAEELDENIVRLLSCTLQHEEFQSILREMVAAQEEPDLATIEAQIRELNAVRVNLIKGLGLGLDPVLIKTEMQSTEKKIKSLEMKARKTDSGLNCDVARQIAQRLPEMSRDTKRWLIRALVEYIRIDGSAVNVNIRLPEGVGGDTYFGHLCRGIPLRLLPHPDPGHD